MLKCFFTNLLNVKNEESTYFTVALCLVFILTYACMCVCMCIYVRVFIHVVKGELHKAHDREAVELCRYIIEERYSWNDRDLCREQPFHTGESEALKTGKSMNNRIARDTFRKNRLGFWICKSIFWMLRFDLTSQM